MRVLGAIFNVCRSYRGKTGRRGILLPTLNRVKSLKLLTDDTRIKNYKTSVLAKPAKSPAKQNSVEMF